MSEDMNKLSEEEVEQATGGYSCRVLRYAVVRGDTLSGIAYRFRTTIRAIMSLNPMITNPDFIRVGWVLTIPDGR